MRRGQERFHGTLQARWGAQCMLEQRDTAQQASAFGTRTRAHARAQAHRHKHEHRRSRTHTRVRARAHTRVRATRAPSLDEFVRKERRLRAGAEVLGDVLSHFLGRSERHKEVHQRRVIAARQRLELQAGTPQASTRRLTPPGLLTSGSRPTPRRLAADRPRAQTAQRHTDTRPSFPACEAIMVGAGRTYSTRAAPVAAPGHRNN
jgi:hypothetical protein